MIRGPWLLLLSPNNAVRQARREAAAQRTLYAVAPKPYLYPVASAGLPASWTSTT
jgi:hypothetical protein